MSTSDEDKSPLVDSIQDYLDLLLSPAVESNTDAPRSPETDTDSIEANSPPVLIDAERPDSSATSFDKPVRSKTASTIALEKPFAEPVKPLAIKLPMPAMAKAEEQPVVKEPPVVIETSSEEIAETAKKPENVIPPEPATEVEQALTESEEHSVDVVKKDSHEWMDNGRPAWAQEAFECLLFKVGGLTLAVPLVELGSIYPVTEALTPLFGQAEWFMGLLKVKDYNLRTVDTAMVVMPERYHTDMRANYHYVISINDVDWGLGVDSVARSVTLKPDDVHWRSERSKRPWLAGTVIEHMCALLDVSRLAEMFVGQDRNRERP